MEEIIPIKTDRKLVSVDHILTPCPKCQEMMLPFMQCSVCKHPPLRKANLSECLSMSKRKGIGTRAIGDIELTHRNKDTRALVRKVAYHNIPTWYLQRFWATDLQLLSSLWVTLSNDEVEHNPRRTCVRASYEGGVAAMSQSSSKTLDYEARTWTYSATFDPPTTESRFISFIGLAHDDAELPNGGTYNYAIYPILAGKTLTTTEEQTTSNLVEVIYRLTLVKG